jgi:hypothetical protein
MEKQRIWVSSRELRLILETTPADPALLDDLRDVREPDLVDGDEVDPDA